MYGIIILDKPRGPTCQQILSKFRKIFPKQKVGYTGTLDPFATGVLPIFIGETTKLIPYVDEQKKTYLATLKLGEATDTLDDTGTLIKSVSIPVLKKEKIQAILDEFRGERQQEPPLFSAVKIKGKPLYRYAREGLSVERAPRRIIVYSLRLLSYDLPLLSFITEVSRGTYVRVLASEIAEALGSVGHLVSLRRVKSGPFSIENSVSLEQVLVNPLASLSKKGIDLRGLLTNFHHLEVIHPEWMRGILMGNSLWMDVPEKGEAKIIRPTERVVFYHKDKVLAISECIQINKNKLYFKQLRVFNPEGFSE